MTNNEQCGICANCVPRINGGSGFNNCEEAHAAQMVEDREMSNKLTNRRTISARITDILVADSVPLSDAWKRLIDDAGEMELELQERRKADNQEPASERERIRREHAEWSDATFGNVGPIGPLKHLSKEALEAAADPSDPLEWADMQFLLWDAQRHMGISDEFITRAMIEKLEINKTRQWPEPKDGEPRLHIKEQPAPVVPEEKPMPNHLSMYAVDAVAAIAEVRGWNACRAAMLQGSQPVSNRDELQVIGWLRSDYNSDDKRDPNAPLFMLGRNDPSETWGVKYIPLSSNSPVIPDDWVMVPKEPTQAMINAWLSEVANWRGHAAGYRAALATAPQQEVK
ncbi:prophage protein [Salmonella enterica]|uniref:Prophage protein n=1 Tax=Salmonella enterica TaxID=28901 RepID=A0A379Q818_SALER|nr:prophage protein [Salmonella enterica]